MAHPEALDIALALHALYGSKAERDAIARTLTVGRGSQEEAADRALYRAKAEGRNRIVAA